MINFASFFSKNVKNTLLLKNGTNIAHKGPWILVYPNTVMDEWYVGDFMSAEYTISVDFGNTEKEIIKCLLVAGPNSAAVTVFGRSNLNNNLVDFTATVNASKVSLIVSPITNQDGSSLFLGSKLIYSATYYHTINNLTP
jgi:hypothetical protein